MPILQYGPKCKQVNNLFITSLTHQKVFQVKYTRSGPYCRIWPVKLINHTIHSHVCWIHNQRTIAATAIGQVFNGCFVVRVNCVIFGQEKLTCTTPKFAFIICFYSQFAEFQVTLGRRTVKAFSQRNWRISEDQRKAVKDVKLTCKFNFISATLICKYVNKWCTIHINKLFKNSNCFIGSRSP